MRPFRFIHAADLHLGSPFAGVGAQSERVRERLREAGYEALNRLVGLAIAEKVDFVLASGDLFDSEDRSLKAQLRLQKAAFALADAGIRLYAVHGNHDPLSSGYRARLDMPETMHVFPPGEVTMQHAVNRAGEQVAEIYGISYAQQHERANLAARFPVLPGLAADSRLFRIGLLHANVDNQPDSTPYAPCTRQDLLRTGIDYWALGHIHVRQVLHESPWIVYPGNLQGRNVKETGPKGAYVVDVSEAGEATLRFCALDAVRWEVKRLSISDMEDEQQLLEQLSALLNEAMPEAADAAKSDLSGQERSAVVRIILEGRGALHETLRPERVAEWQTVLRESSPDADRAFVWLESLRAETLPALDLEELRASDSFVGEMLRAAARLKAAPPDLQQWSPTASLWAHSRIGKHLDDAEPGETAAWIDEAERLLVDWLGDIRLTPGSRGENGEN
ncbi:DNA repair exonuclease [Xylanibacillus composti]|uniref:Exonuclease SbcCD subunit D n=1 Tax=Xylanibacillus composti TaxID=1572762 RepID=A0A8J4H5E9_9BACL|nr:DNA repair exonuclease [Xylanibacillus composti]MDT9725004.1 DNA repair exonuclease [Xylanibacillus composti]GIQ71297.1 exonuclease SbcCD subunit D [Xylanibacillus composti]